MNLINPSVQALSRPQQAGTQPLQRPAPDLSPPGSDTGTALPDELGAVREFYRFRASLAQWRAFHAVIACGGYAGAAEFLHVTQPAISYSISKLEQQVGVRLLKLDGRKAYITDAGRALLARSQDLLRLAAELEAMAMELA